MRIAIVGKPNVGKSTLFNRMIGYKKAIESDLEGTTRDRLYHDLTFDNYTFTLVDTGGIDKVEKGDQLQQEMLDQSIFAIQEADMILFLIDGRSDATPLDKQVADMIRRSDKPCMLVVNKLDHPDIQNNIYNYYDLGFERVVGISAYHKKGVDELLASVVRMGRNEYKFPSLEEEKQDTKEEDIAYNMAILGRPNVGKSSLFNGLVGKSMAIVSDVAGTTRDALDTIVLDEDGRKVRLIDTAGVRRRGKVEKGVEKYSVHRTKRAILRSDVVVLLIDAYEGVTAQDQHIAQMALEEKKGLILVVNKWDLVEEPGNDKQIDEYLRRLEYQLNYLSWMPVIFTSAKTGKRVHKLFDLASSVMESRHNHVSTAQINYFIKQLVVESHPTGTKTFRPKVYYAAQSGTNPPEFIFFVNDPEAFHFSWVRMLENRIREEWDFTGTPIRIVFKGRNPGGRNRIKEPDMEDLDQEELREAQDRLKTRETVEKVF